MDFIVPPLKRRKLSKSSFSTPIKIIVGKGDNSFEFLVQENLICEDAEIFKSICDEELESGMTDTITFEDEDPDIFSLYLTWLLTGNIENSEDFIEIFGDDRDAKIKSAEQQFHHLSKCFVFGDEYRCTSFCNHVMSRLVKCCRASYNIGIIVGIIPKALGYIYPNTCEGSPLRRLVVDNYINGCDFEKRPPRDLTVFENEFYLDVCYRLGRMLREGEKTLQVWTKFPCPYYPTRHTGLLEIEEARFNLLESEDYTNDFDKRNTGHKRKRSDDKTPS